MMQEWPIGDDNMTDDDWEWRDDGLTEAEAQEMADRWRQTVAADLTPHDLARLRQDAEEGKIPRRRLRR